MSVCTDRLWRYTQHTEYSYLDLLSKTYDRCYLLEIVNKTEFGVIDDVMALHQT